LHDHQGPDSGAAYVYERNGGNWVQQAELLPSDGLPHDYTGQNKVALDGDTILLGAHRHPENGVTGVGIVYVFERHGELWHETARLSADDGEPGDQFGVAVELDGDTAVVGANGDQNPGATRGSVYVFVRDGDSWSQQARLHSDRPVDGYTGFGERISLDGDTLAVGAWSTHFQGMNSGSVYVFERATNTWTEQAMILASDGFAQEQFSIVALQADTLMVGACRCHQPDQGGSVYVFERSGNGWTERQKLSPLDGVPLNHFGASVALDGNRAIIGAPGESDGRAGTAYSFTRSGGVWTQEQKLMPGTSKADDKFGARVSLDGGSVLIGARGNQSRRYDGSAFVFELGSEFSINAGLNDAWYNPATPGQGFLIAVYPRIQQMFVAWFTFDIERPTRDVRAMLGEPGHRWLTAQGPYSGDTANLGISVTRGGVFDAASPPAITDAERDGTLTLEFADCNAAMASYTIASLGVSGEIPLERIVLDNVPACQDSASPQNSEPSGSNSRRSAER
jgi:hypothetical protein